MSLAQTSRGARAARRDRRSRRVALAHACGRILALCLSLAVADRSALAEPGDISTFAGGVLPASQPALEVAQSVSDVAVSGGFVYTADSQNEVIRRLDTATGISTIVAGSQIQGFGGDGGPATAALLHDPVGVAVAGDGSLIIADAANRRIRKVSPAGTITTIAGTGHEGSSGDGGLATGATFRYPRAVAVDPAGNVFVGDSLAHRVRRIGIGGLITTVAGDGTPDHPLASPNGLAADASGAVFIASKSHIWRRDPSGTLTVVAGNGTSTFSGDGGPALAAGFDGAADVAVDAAGRLLVKDFFRIRLIDESGIVTTVAGTDIEGFSGDGGPATAATLLRGGGLDFIGDGYVLSSLSRLRRIESGIISTIAGNDATETRFYGDGGAATSAGLTGFAVTFDSTGNAYIADQLNARIRKVDPAGTITTVAGTGETGFSGDGGPAIAARLLSPRGIVVDSSDAVIFGDEHRLRMIDGDGIISTIAGTGSGGLASETGPATTVRLTVGFLTLAPSGDIVFSDPSALCVRKLTPGGVVSTIAGNGSYDWAGNGGVPDGGLAVDASFRLPTGVAVAADGAVFVADLLSGLIRRVAPDGTITTVAGRASQPGNGGDGGPALEASFLNLQGLAIDGSGSLFVADAANHRVRVIDTGGIVRGVVGTGTPGFSGDGGPSNAARLNTPTSLSFDRAGDLYIADNGNRRIRKVDAPFATVPICGNSVIETSETCDDGNTTSGDCCSASCTREPDADADGTCDALDACTNVAGARTFLVKPKPRLVLSQIGSDATPGDDQIGLVASFTLPAGASFADLDPIEDEVRLVIDDAASVRKVDLTFPAAAYDPLTRFGWTLSRTGRAWTFVDRRAVPATGIARVVLSDRNRSATPRRVQIAVRGRNGSYPIVSGDQPVTAIVAFGGASGAAAGLCTESGFDGPSDCLFSREGHQLSCRKR